MSLTEWWAYNQMVSGALCEREVHRVRQTVIATYVLMIVRTSDEQHRLRLYSVALARK
jgi:hypothetical protein